MDNILSLISMRAYRGLMHCPWPHCAPVDECNLLLPDAINTRREYNR